MIRASKRILVPLTEMEAMEKRTKLSKNQEHAPMENAETRVIQLGHTPSTHTGDMNSIDTGRERRRRKQSVIVERDDGEYR